MNEHKTIGSSFSSFHTKVVPVRSSVAIFLSLNVDGPGTLMNNFKTNAMKSSILIIAAMSALSLFLFWPSSDELPPEAFAEKIKATRKVLLIDLRTASEFSSGHIPGAMNIDRRWPSYIWRVAELDTALPVFFYCRGGEFNKEVAIHFLSQGFVSVTALKGGIQQWKNAELLVTPVEVAPPNELTFQDFSRLLDMEHYVIVDFYIPWNIDCRKMEPIIDALAIDNRKKIKILRINIDKYKHLATEMGIETIPSLQFYENGNLVSEMEGVGSRGEVEQELLLDDYLMERHHTLSASTSTNKR